MAALPYLDDIFVTAILLQLVASSCADFPAPDVLKHLNFTPVSEAVAAVSPETVNDVLFECLVVPLQDVLSLFNVHVCHEPPTYIPATRPKPLPVPSKEEPAVRFAVTLTVTFTDVGILADVDASTTYFA